MTPNTPMSGSVDAPVDKILDHNRLQLSALIDGELSADEARFLLRRLQHDPELADCWERWQLCGDVLRSRVDAIVPDGFSRRVATALAAEPQASKANASAGGPRWLRWGGGAALAASVAVIALFLARQSPDANTPATRSSGQTIAVMPAHPSQPDQPASSQPAPANPHHAAQLATALAVADIPRRFAARRSRGQSQRAALRATTRSIVQAPIAIASVTAQPATTQPSALQVDPFSAQRVSVE
ncbi:MAG: hypothetical protein H0T88_05900, partial [Lysobacter sp.]|nr:hypothetical protein [Lysobacter sp.]